MKEYAGKVLMLAETNFFVDFRVRREAYTLVRAGYKVTVIAIRGKGERAKENVQGVEVYRVPRITLFKKSCTYKPSYIQRFLYGAKSAIGYIFEYLYFTSACLILSPYILFKEGFDIIHAHNPPDTLFVVGAFYKLLGKKFVFDHHDLSPELYLSKYGVEDGIFFRGLLIVEKLCLRLSNMVIATNESYKEIDIKRGCINSKRVFVVRNGPDINGTKLMLSDEKLKKLNKCILGYVGAINPQDGVDYLLRAIKCLVYEIGRTDFFCVIIGSGDSLENLKALASELEIERYVWFTGYIPEKDKLRYLSTADICVDPDPSSPLNDVSTWMKIMDYMALGKPIVSFDLKESRYTAQKAAIYVSPNDEKDFANAIVRLMDNPEERERMGAFGYRRIREELAWQHISRNLLSAYDWLLEKTNNRGSNIKV